MSRRQVELSLKDGFGRTVELTDNPNLPVSFYAPFVLFVNHKNIGFFSDSESILKIDSNSLIHNDALLSDILSISQEVSA